MSMNAVAPESYLHKLNREHKERQARLGAAPVVDHGVNLKRQPQGKRIVPAVEVVAPIMPDAALAVVGYVVRKRTHIRKPAADALELPHWPFIPPTPIARLFKLDECEDSYRPRPTVKRIQQLVGWRCNLRRDDLLSRHRQLAVVRPRQVAMYLSKTLTVHSLPELGRRFAGKDHTTVLHAVRRIAALRAAGDLFVTEAIAAIGKILAADGFDVSPLILSQAGMDVESLGVVAG